MKFRQDESSSNNKAYLSRNGHKEKGFILEYCVTDTPFATNILDKLQTAPNFLKGQWRLPVLVFF